MLIWTLYCHLDDNASSANFKNSFRSRAVLMDDHDYTVGNYVIRATVVPSTDCILMFFPAYIL